MWQQQYERYASGFSVFKQRPFFAFAMRQPRWVTLTAIIAATLVIAVPLILLTIAAILVGILVMFVFGIIATLTNLFRALFVGSTADRSGFSDSSGRRNVRVINRPPTHTPPRN